MSVMETPDLCLCFREDDNFMEILSVWKKILYFKVKSMAHFLAQMRSS